MRMKDSRDVSINFAPCSIQLAFIVYNSKCETVLRDTKLQSSSLSHGAPLAGPYHNHYAHMASASLSEQWYGEKITIEL